MLASKVGTRASETCRSLACKAGPVKWVTILCTNAVTKCLEVQRETSPRQAKCEDVRAAPDGGFCAVTCYDVQKRTFVCQ